MAVPEPWRSREASCSSDKLVKDTNASSRCSNSWKPRPKEVAALQRDHTKWVEWRRECECLGWVEPWGPHLGVAQAECRVRAVPKADLPDRILNGNREVDSATTAVVAGAEAVVAVEDPETAPWIRTPPRAILEATNVQRTSSPSVSHRVSASFGGALWHGDAAAGTVVERRERRSHVLTIQPFQSLQAAGSPAFATKFDSPHRSSRTLRPGVGRRPNVPVFPAVPG